MTRNIKDMLFEFIRDEDGLTHSHVLEHFLLLLMIVSIMALVISEFPVFYVKLWTRIIDATIFK